MGLAGGSYVLSSRAFQDFLRLLSPLRTVAVHGKQNAPFLDSAFITLRFIFGYASSDQSSGQPSYRTAGTSTGQGSHNGTGRDEWTDAGDRECTDTYEPT